MKALNKLFVFLLFAQPLFSNAGFCPDAPSNDNPCASSSNPPIELTGGGSHEGTTCCATFDFENIDCSAATQDASVWYTYIPNGDDDEYDVILEPLDVEGPISMEVYWGASDAGCGTSFDMTLIESSCNGSVELNIGDCFPQSSVVYVKVTTDESENNCGSFVITIAPSGSEPSPDECIDLMNLDPITPITDDGFGISYNCVSGNLGYACPEDDAMGGCPEFTQMPTVWYQIVVDDNASQMLTTVEPMGQWDPVWSIFSGPDCDNLTLVDFGGTPSCSNGSNTPELLISSVFDEEENYWIMITVDPISLPASGLDDGSFELCVATTNNVIICMGEMDGGACNDESLEMEVTHRELENLPLDGPFAQGEEVTIEISFFYDASESGGDWLMGLVPNFGPGWDMTNFDYELNAPFGNGQTSLWYEEGSNCAPILQEANPILCTYVDDDGNLQICNQLCSPCSECDQQGMNAGDPLPGGYFWVSTGQNIGCENDCSPGEGWGIGSTMAQIDWAFTLTTKVFEDPQECIDKKDLSISFQTFSHGSLGCWEDPVGECMLDRMMSSPAWEIECGTPPEVLGDNQEICHGGTTNILLQTEDGSTNTIIVEVEDNPNVTGEMNHTFTGGTGTITDNLFNPTNSVEVVVYSVYAEDETLPNSGPINQIEVEVHPKVTAFLGPDYHCASGCAIITTDVVGGVGYPYSFLWSTGDVGDAVEVCPLVPTTYYVTVEDGLGCSAMAEVLVEVQPPMGVAFFPDSIIVTKDEEFDPSNPEFVTCVYPGGSAPYTIIWDAPPGLVGSALEGFNCFVINQDLSSSTLGNNGQYYLKATVTDFFGCIGVDSTLITVLGDSIEDPDYKLIYDFFIDDNGNGIRDSLENSFGEGAFFLEPEQTIYYNTSLGPDTLSVNEGVYTLTYIPATTDDWILSTDSVVTVVIDSDDNCVKAEFGLKRQDLIRNVELSHFLIRRCNTSQQFYLAAENNGTKIEEGILWAELDEAIIPDDIAVSTDIDTFIAPNTIGWFFDDLLPGNTIVKTVDVYVPGPPDFPVGWVLNHTIKAELDNGDGTTEIFGERELSGSIQCGYDPNDKAVEPNHEEGYTLIDQEDLIFKIRFQNTGNAPAYNIQIRDTLSEFLDISSVQYISGSHDGHLTFSRTEDRVLVFDFDNIYLPDSTTDLEGSQGFFLYRVSIIDDLPEGTLIENTAHIYFDNNPAVVTNTTKNILYPDMDGDGYFSVEDCNEEDININPGAEEVANNDVDEDCDGVALIIDNDMDGFNSDEDCDDENPDINPDAEEIINNDVDENCDDVVVVIDNDMDGFNSSEDCDDENAEINPNSEEIANNDVDEDCDGVALVIDEDMDGFNSDDDCDDSNADINPDAEEIANNDVDENCDGVALVIDEDMDGFNSDEDCDDANADINPDAEEIANNDVDENCDGVALVIDNDMDGFNSDEDCDDENPDINPDAEEIANNGIDEDCDGEDAVVIGLDESNLPEISIHPNPSNDVFNITISQNHELDYTIRDVIGRKVASGSISSSRKTIYLGSEPNGLYLIIFSHPDQKQTSFYKLLKI